MWARERKRELTRQAGAGFVCWRGKPRSTTAAIQYNGEGSLQPNRKNSNQKRKKKQYGPIRPSRPSRPARPSRSAATSAPLQLLRCRARTRDDTWALRRICASLYRLGKLALGGVVFPPIFARLGLSARVAPGRRPRFPRPCSS